MAELSKENRPDVKHYSSCAVEPIDFIRGIDAQTFMGFCIGNVIKYAARYKRKNGIEDLKKARDYLNWAIEAAE